MAGCRIANEGVKTAVTELTQSSANYKSAGETLIADFDKAIMEMEGAAKDALKNFLDQKVKPYVEESLPKAIEGMKTLLEANRTNFVTVDKQLADSIGQ